jgi:hypothetical protein
MELESSLGRATLRPLRPGRVENGVQWSSRSHETGGPVECPAARVGLLTGRCREK